MAINTKSKDFFGAIDSLVWKHDISYLDAAVMYCEKNNLEVESIAPLIKNNALFKSRVQIEAEDLNYLPKTARISI